MKDNNTTGKLNFQDISQHLGIQTRTNPKNVSDKFVPPFDFDDAEIKSGFVGTQISMSLFRLLLSRAILLVSLVGMMVATVMLNIDGKFQLAKRPSPKPSSTFARPLVSAEAVATDASPARTQSTTVASQPAKTQPAKVANKRPTQTQPVSADKLPVKTQPAKVAKKPPVVPFLPKDITDPTASVLAGAQKITTARTARIGLDRVRAQISPKIAAKTRNRGQFSVASHKFKPRTTLLTTVAIVPFPDDLFRPQTEKREELSAKTQRLAKTLNRERSSILVANSSATKRIKGLPQTTSPITPTAALNQPTAVSPAPALAPVNPIVATTSEPVWLGSGRTRRLVAHQSVESNGVRGASALPNRAGVPPTSGDPVATPAASNLPAVGADPTLAKPALGAIVPPPPPPPPVIVGSVAPLENRAGALPTSNRDTIAELPQPEAVVLKNDLPTQQIDAPPSSPTADLPIAFDTSIPIPKVENRIVPKQPSLSLPEPMIATASSVSDSSPGTEIASTSERERVDPILFAPTAVAKILTNSPADEFSNESPMRVAPTPKRIALSVTPEVKELMTSTSQSFAPPTVETPQFNKADGVSFTGIRLREKLKSPAPAIIQH